MGWRWIRLAALAAIAAALCAAEAWAGPEAARVLIVAPPLVRADALWMAAAHGFFKDENLAVTVRWVSSGREALQALNRSVETLAGAAVFVVVSEMLAVDAWQSTEGDFVVVAPLARDGEGYVVVARKTVSAPAALRGTLIATQLGSTTAWILGEVLRAHRMTERDVALRHESPDAVLSWTPQSSDTSAFAVREPHASRALQRHGDAVHRLATGKGYAHGYLMLGTSRRYLREYPGVTERVLRALDRGRLHAAQHRDDVILFARDMFGTDTSAVDPDYLATERLLAVDATALTDLRNLGRWMRDAGLLRTGTDPLAAFHLDALRAVFPDRVLTAEPPARR